MRLNAEVSSWKNKSLALERQVDDLEKKVRDFDKRAELLVADKMVVEERLEVVEGKLEKSQKLNEGLNIRVENLEMEVASRDELLEKRRVESKKLGDDLEWLVKEGVVTIVDRVIDTPEFTHGLGRVQSAAYAAGERAALVRVQREMAAGTFVPGDIGSTSSSVEYLDDALQSFAALDYASLLKLGSLSIEGLRELCRIVDEEVPEEHGASMEHSEKSVDAGAAGDGDATGGDGGGDATGGDGGAIA